MQNPNYFLMSVTNLPILWVWGLEKNSNPASPVPQEDSEDRRTKHEESQSFSPVYGIEQARTSCLQSLGLPQATPFSSQAGFDILSSVCIPQI